MKCFLKHITLFILLIGIFPVESVLHSIKKESGITVLLDLEKQSSESKDDPEKDLKDKFAASKHSLSITEPVESQSIIVLHLIFSKAYRSTETPPPDFS